MSEIKGVKVAGGVYSLNDEIVRAALENLKKQLGDGSLVVGLANAVKAGAITLEMLDEKLKLSVSVVNDLETDDALKPLSANQGKVLKELIDIINGTGEGSTDKKITDAIAKLVDNAPENLDTLKELVEWIENHGTEAAEMLAAIKANANNLAETKKDIANQLIVTPAADSVGVTGRNEQSMRINFSADIPAATTETAGVMTAKDKTKLDNLAVEGAEVNLNTYMSEGTYFFSSKKLTNVPILNDSVVSARLTVLTAHDGVAPVITQVLNLNNLGGGEGNVYIRSNQKNIWKPWGKLQTNVEVGQITPDDMSNLIDNGIYSGVCVDGTTVETFVLIVINNYLAASQAGFGSYISQLKYAIDLNSGNTVKTRTRDAYGIWSEWSEIGGSTYKLPEATTSTLGGVKLGTVTNSSYAPLTNINPSSDGVGIAINPSCFINIGTDAILSIRHNDSLSIDSNSGLSVCLGTNDVYRISKIIPCVLGSVTPSDNIIWNKTSVGIPYNEEQFYLKGNGLNLKKDVISVVDDSENPVQSKAIAAAIAEGEKRALRRLFVAAGAEYNDTGADITKTAPWGETVVHKAGHYYLNGLGNITEEQMMAIYNAPHNAIYPLAYTGYARDKNVRTLILKGTGGHVALNNVSIASIFNSCLIETLDFKSIFCIDSKLDSMFKNCTKLTHIKGTVFCQNCSINQIFYGCVNLKTVDVQRLNKDISFSDSAELSKNSVLNMINNAITTSAITLTLHPDAYARLADDAEIVAALEAQPLISLVSA